MKKYGIGFGLGRPSLALLNFTAICVLSISSAQASLIAEWQFDSLSTYGASGTAISLSGYSPEYGVQSATATLTTGATGNGFMNNNQGTSINQYASTSPNWALKSKNATAGTITLQVSGAGLSSFILTYATRNVASVAQTWSYSTDGTTYSSLGITGGSVNPASGGVWASFSVDFSGVSGLDGASAVYLQDSFTTPSGAGTSGDTVSFDNFAITAVPEPVSCALAGFGLIFVGGTVGRFYLRRRRPAIAS